MPPENAAAIVARTVELKGYAGPLPAPEILEGYEKVMPGAAKIIIDMAVGEQAFRHKTVNRDLILRTFLVAIGQLCAFILGISGIAGAVFLLYHDKSISGLAVFIGSLATLVGVYIANRKSKPIEN